MEELGFIVPWERERRIHNSLYWTCKDDARSFLTRVSLKSDFYQLYPSINYPYIKLMPPLHTCIWGETFHTMSYSRWALQNGIDHYSQMRVTRGTFPRQFCKRFFIMVSPSHMKGMNRESHLFVISTQPVTSSVLPMNDDERSYQHGFALVNCQESFIAESNA